jgi:DNA topoisomerase-1
LRYASDRLPGICRLRAGRGWRYLDADGTPITDGDQLARIRAIVIPPAWRDVWINPHPRGHIQATGRDERGRKQYRYHPAWRAARDETKFSHLVAFGQALPALRQRVACDLARPGLPRDKVVATIVRLLDESLLRIGNDEYERENGSYGLTTLHDKHVDVSGSHLRFAFRGKSGKLNEVDVRDRRVSSIIRRLQELPGQHLFQYIDETGSAQSVNSEEVNAYLQEVSGQAFTAKEFRTWGGTVLAAHLLCVTPPTETETERKAAIVTALDAVAARLGNTRAVCRASYIHPAILRAYEAGAVCDELSAFGHRLSADGPGLDQDEQRVLAFLSKHQ